VPNKTVFASSLGCTEATLVAGDVSRYLCADAQHPTPWGCRLLAQSVTPTCCRPAGSGLPWLHMIGVNRIAPDVDSDKLSAPSVPGTKIDVNGANSGIFTAATC
jgi:phospholipase/lecithinase/hemolysin